MLRASGLSPGLAKSKISKNSTGSTETLKLGAPTTSEIVSIEAGDRRFFKIGKVESSAGVLESSRR